MVMAGRRSREETIRTVLDDGTAERLRLSAERYGIEVEQLIVELVVAASCRVDELLPSRARPSGPRTP
jgi:hypothetical protein